MRLLLSGGGTREPIDGVRFITNFSTGKTAAGLADFFAERGHEVVGFFSEGAELPLRPEVRIKRFSSFQDLNQAFERVLAEERFDAIVHLAAVSDFSVAEIRNEEGDILTGGKIPSDREVTLKLRPNFKIVDRLKSYSRLSAPRVIAFKLTHTPVPHERAEAVKKLVAGGGADAVVHNDLGDRNSGRPLFTLYQGLEALGCARDATELGVLLEKFLEKRES